MTTDEKLKTGYQASIALISTSGQMIWTSFSGMISANTALVALSGAILKIFPNLTFGSNILSTLGIIICIGWFFVLRRHFSYYRYWFAWARHLEKIGLSPEVRIISIGKVYGEGGSLEPDANTPILPAFGWMGRAFKVETMMSIVIFVFVFIYSTLIYASIAP
jgi:hypothetical protein